MSQARNAFVCVLVIESLPLDLVLLRTWNKQFKSELLIRKQNLQQTLKGIHIYYLQKSTSSLVFIYNRHIANLKNRKQLHYTLCEIQVCYLGRISDYCPHLQVLKFVCALIPMVLLAAVHLILVRTGGLNNTYIRFTDDSPLAC